MSRLILLITSLLVVVLPSMNASAHHNDVTTRYYLVGDASILMPDIQAAWKARLKGTAYNASTIQALAHYGLLTPIYIDTDVQVGTWTASAEPLFITSGAPSDMVPLNVIALEAGKGDYSEGDTIQPIGADHTNVDLFGRRLWFALDSDGTLLVACDGAPIYFSVEGLH